MTVEIPAALIADPDPVTDGWAAESGDPVGLFDMPLEEKGDIHGSPVSAIEQEARLKLAHELEAV
jgi:hypothetical protein